MNTNTDLQEGLNMHRKAGKLNKNVLRPGMHPHGNKVRGYKTGTEPTLLHRH